jgi:bifunctional non-homologous end joining protein LigD
MTFERTKDYARAVASDLVDEREDVVANMRKALRKGHIFIDWSQNSTHKTTVCAYSLRARESATVSAPITWDEVRRAVKKQDAGSLLLSTDEVAARAEKHGDLFADVLTCEQALPR